MPTLKWFLLSVFFLFTSAVLWAQPLPTATPIGMANDSFFTNMGNKIYKMGRVATTWYYAFDLPLAVSDADIVRLCDQDQILVIKNDSALTYYRISTKTVTNTTIRKSIAAFCSNPIKEIVFHNGVAGCFASSRVEDHYQYNGGESFSFKYTDTKNNRAKLKLPEMESPMEPAIINDFIQQFPSFLYTKTSWVGLGITAADFVQCKNEIAAFAENKPSSFSIWNRDKINWNRLLAIPDSLQIISSDKLQKLLKNTEEIVSTNSFTAGVKFINTNGETLSLSSSCYTTPNKFYFPWNLTLNGIVLEGFWPEISAFLKVIYPGFLQNKSQLQLLNDLVRNFYYFQFP